EDAGAARDVALHAEGLAVDGPKRPDRVDVGHDQQGLFVGAARAAPAGYGQVAVLALGVHLHLRAERPALLLEVGGQRVDRRLVGAWGLTADHLAHGREQVLAPLVHRLDQRHCPSSPLTDPVPTSDPVCGLWLRVHPAGRCGPPATDRVPPGIPPRTAWPGDSEPVSRAPARRRAGWPPGRCSGRRSPSSPSQYSAAWTRSRPAVPDAGPGRPGR